MPRQVSLKMLALESAKDVAAIAIITKGVDVGIQHNLIGAAIAIAVGFTLLLLDRIVTHGRMGLLG